MTLFTITDSKARPPRIRRALIVAGLAAGLLAGGAGVAAASQSGTVSPNQTKSFSTWFWGKTQVCVKNLDQANDASYTWQSLSTNGSGGLVPNQQNCFTRSFVGGTIRVTDVSPRASLQVTFPIGP